MSTCNKFKSTNVCGTFNNVDDTVDSINANGNFQRNRIEFTIRFMF